MAPHHHADIDARQRRIVEIGAGEGLGDEARGRRETGCVVVLDQIVVDRLRNMDAAQRVSSGLCFFADDAHGVRRIVATDIEEMADAVRAQDLEDLVAISGVGLVARRAQCRARRVRDQFEVVAGFLGQVDEVFIDDAAHAMPGAIDQFDLMLAPCFEDDTNQRLVDDCGRSAALGYQNFC